MAGVADPLLFPEVASRALSHLSSMTPRDLSLLMSVFAKARISHELLFEGIAENFIESNSKSPNSQILKNKLVLFGFKT